MAIQQISFYSVLLGFLCVCLFSTIARCASYHDNNIRSVVVDSHPVKDSVDDSYLPAGAVASTKDKNKNHLLTNKDLLNLQSSGQFIATPREGKVVTEIPVTVQFPNKPAFDAFLVIESEVDYADAMAKSKSFTFPLIKGQSKENDQTPNLSNSTSIMKSLVILLFGESAVSMGIIPSVISPVTSFVGQEWDPTPPLKSLLSLLGLSKNQNSQRTQQGVSIVQTQVSLISFGGRKNSSLLNNSGIIQSIVKTEDKQQDGNEVIANGKQGGRTFND